MNYLRIRNWEKFQHYKDRKPTWIKLYVELLDDWEFSDLTDAQFGQLAKLWLLAARTDNAIPEDPKLVAHWIGADSKIDLEFFVSRRLLVRTKTKRRRGDRQRAANRYIPRDVRTHVLERDGYRCVQCSATLWLEIDHIKPVSKGGKSTLGNLQTLCRSCNRQKRSTEQVATQTLRRTAQNRSLEEETEEEREEKIYKSSNGYVLPEHAVEKLLRSLKDKDPQTRGVVSGLGHRHRLAEGDFAWALECATGPGVVSPTRVAIAELKKRGADRSSDASSKT